jgi:subtilisin family serine protease
METDTVSLTEAIEYAVSKKVIVVAAVGNDGIGRFNYPAAYDGVIGVGSVDADKAVSAFSQKNSSVFITAPGNEVLTLGLDDDYKKGKGTSFSTPLVAGAVAVAKCIDESLDTGKISDALARSAEDLGAPGYDINYGHGLLNIESFINILLENTDWFVSPVDKNNGEYSVFVYNNGNNKNTAVSIFAGYGGNRIIHVEANAISLPGKQYVNVTFIYDCAEVKHFLWNDLVAMNPLYAMRKAN